MRPQYTPASNAVTLAPTPDPHPGPTPPRLPLPRKDRLFVSFDLAIFDRFFPALSGAEVKVYLVLSRHANKHSQCWPSVGTLARETGLTARPVQYALRRLRAKGLVDAQKRWTDAGDPDSNLYTLLLPPADPPQTPPQETASQGGVVLIPAGGLSQTPPGADSSEGGGADSSEGVVLIPAPKPDPQNQTQEELDPPSVSPPSGGENTQIAPVGAGEGNGEGEDTHTDMSVLTPIWETGIPQKYPGTPLCDPARWLAQCPEEVRDRRLFFAKLAAEIAAASIFQDNPPPKDAAASAIRDHVYRVTQAMTVGLYVVKRPGAESRNGHQGGPADVGQGT